MVIDDPGSVTSDVITNLIVETFDRFWKGVSKVGRDTRQKIFEDFAPFMRSCYNRNKYVRILCSGDADVDIEEIYVASKFTCAGKQKTEREVIYAAHEGSKIVVVGNGGAGKTFFMRKLWLEIFKESSKTPFFIELRRLNSIATMDLKAFIRFTLSPRLALSDAVFDAFCDQGRFVFILDGFDEVSEDRHEELQEQIFQLAEMFPKCSFVVSSRYDSRFNGWQGFSVLEVMGLSLPQVKALCQKVPFDPQFRTLFLKQLNNEFFKQNESFLSNPLLAVMMMMTFKENMDIPRKMGIFYDQAFNTLYQRHDATKAYKREKLLDVQQFQRSFGAFCLLSYYREKYEFTKAEIIEFINYSNEMNGYDFNSEKILADYERNVNLIRQDGLLFVFIHRSFQEYFAAKTLVARPHDEFHAICGTLMRRRSDSVIRMCYDLDNSVTIKAFIEPYYKTFGILDFIKSSSRRGKFAVLSDFNFSISAGFRRETEVKSGKRRSLTTASALSVTAGADGPQPRGLLVAFVTLVLQLSGNKVRTDFGPLAHLIDGGVFSSLSEVASAIVSEESFLLKFTFSDDQILCFRSANFDEISLSAGEDSTLEPIVLDIKNGLLTHFEMAAAKTLKDFVAVDSWCRSKIKVDQLKDKTVTELFNLRK